jgi:hypothetical protein
MQTMLRLRKTGMHIAWNVDFMLLQVFKRLFIQISLPVAGKVFEMGFDDGCALPHDVLHYRLFIVRSGFTLDDADRAIGAGPYARAQAVAEQVAYESSLTVDDLDGSLRAVRDALPASRAFVFVDADDLPFHRIV